MFAKPVRQTMGLAYSNEGLLDPQASEARVTESGIAWEKTCDHDVADYVDWRGWAVVVGSVAENRHQRSAVSDQLAENIVILVAIIILIETGTGRDYD
jgi:hypothetical protein